MVFGVNIQISNKEESQFTEPLDGPMDSAWPMLSHDLYHTGQSELSTARNPGAELWRIQSSYNSEMFQTTPVIDNNGTIYIGLKGYDDNSWLIAYYSNGTERWRFLSDSWIWCTPAIGDDGTIYFTTCGDYFYAVNPDGTLKWKFDHDSFCIYSSPAIGPDGTIYFGVCTGIVYALRPDGTEKWHHAVGGSVQSSPVIGPDGTIYIGSNDFYLYALNPEDGEMIWHYQTGYSIRGSPSLAYDGTIYVPSFDGYLYALHSNNGTFKWRATTGPKVAGAGCAIANDGTIYVGTEKLRAYNPNGTLKWESDVKGWVYGTVPAISSDGTIYVSGGGCLVAVNPDGTIKWYKQLTSIQIETSPCIGPDDRVYIASTEPGYIPVNYFSAFGVGPVRADAQGPYHEMVTIPLQFQGLDFGGVPPYSYFWDFGDGNTSTLINPVHTYSQVGNYTASFTIIDSQGNISTDMTNVTIKPYEDNPPDNPDIDGPLNGFLRVKYTYTAISIDQDGDYVSYFFDWGDNSNSGWTELVPSGTPISRRHYWVSEGTYDIKVKAKDVYGMESDWTILTVTMPRNRAYSNTLLLRLLEQFPLLREVLLRLIPR